LKYCLKRFNKSDDDHLQTSTAKKPASNLSNNKTSAIKKTAQDPVSTIVSFAMFILICVLKMLFLI
jgi:hypothetical protein